MVGIFPKLSGRISGHHRSPITADTSEKSQTNLETIGSLSADDSQGTENFRLIEQPVEPLNRDQPVRCPLPEPSILNDGGIWKARMSSVNTRLRTELPVMKDESGTEGEAEGPKPPPPSTQKRMSPSLSAP